MPSSLIDADSILAVDVGSSTTRAILFDVVDGGYRFIAIGRSSSTAFAPYNSVDESFYTAVENLQEITGRTFFSAKNELIIPSQDGNGIDQLVVTLSAGPAIRTAIVGLLNDVSLQSVNRLARSTYARIVESIGVNDRRKAEEQIDSLLQVEPELILMAGGTDGGATQSVRKILDIVGLACHLMPLGKRPSVLFAGNQDVADEVNTTLKPLTASVDISANLRPTLDREDLQPAARMLADVTIQIRKNNIGGLQELSSLSGGNLLPSAYAEGRLIRFMSKAYTSGKGVLGIDLGASAATIAAGFNGDLNLGVYPQFGLGEGVSNLLRYCSLEDITRWIPLEVPSSYVLDYIHHKSMYPNSIPATLEDMAVEQAIARQALRLAYSTLQKDIPVQFKCTSLGTPYFEPILVSGSAITDSTTIGQGLLMVLDGIQPVGTTTILFDKNHLLPGIGAAAANHVMLPVHLLESGAFQGVASLIVPHSTARPGMPILQGSLVTTTGVKTDFEAKQGTLDLIPFPVESSGTLSLKPLHHADVGFGPGRSGEMRVSGTLLGLVIDARGRPLQLTRDDAHRRELIKKWIWTLGG